MSEYFSGGPQSTLRIYAEARVPDLNHIHDVLHNHAAEHHTTFQPMRPVVILKEVTGLDDLRSHRRDAIAKTRSKEIIDRAETLARHFGNVPLQAEACAVLPMARRNTGRLAILGAQLNPEARMTIAARQLITEYLASRQHPYISLQLGNFASEVAAGRLEVEGLQGQSIVLERAQARVAPPSVQRYADYR